jgi:hypothetical protein
MSLVDFMQELQTQDIVFSTPPEPSIQVIPPEKAVTKVIPPEDTDDEVKKPTVIKLKIKQTSVSVNTKPTPSGEENTNTTPQTSSIQAESSPPPAPPPVEVPVAEKTVESTPDVSIPSTPSETAVIKQQPVEDDMPKMSEEDELFLKSGTEISKKPKWIEVYRQAKASRKVNPYVDRCKIGKFIITDTNEVLILPDYNVVGKDPDAILRDKWF